MAYTVPSVAGVPIIRYLSNNTGNEYTAGKTLPSIANSDNMLLCQRSDGSGNIGPDYIYSSTLGGWIYCGEYNSTYYNAPILTSINGKSVLYISQYKWSGSSILLDTKGGFEKSVSGMPSISAFTPTIPSTIRDIHRMFYGQTQLAGVINIDANPTVYADWLTGTVQPIKLTGKSTMLEELAAGYSNVSVYIPPTAKLLAQRINAATGELDDEGTKPKITLTMTGDPVNTTYSLELFMDDLTTPLDTRTFTVPDSGEYEIIFTPNETLDMDTSHTFRANITDSYGTVREVSDVLTQAFFTMDMGFEGHEIAFGGSAKELQDLKDAGREDEIPANGKFNCFMDADFKANVKIKNREFEYIGECVTLAGNAGQITLSTAAANYLTGRCATWGESDHYADVYNVATNPATITVKKKGIYLVKIAAYFTTGFTVNDLIHVNIEKQPSGSTSWTTMGSAGFLERVNNASYYRQTSSMGYLPLDVGDSIRMTAYNQTAGRGQIYVNGYTSLQIIKIY